MPKAMSWLIGREKFELNTRVRIVERNRETGKIYVHASNGKDEIYEFDRVISTIPANASFQIDWRNFDDFEYVVRAFRSFGTEPLYKLALQFRGRFWEDQEML